MRDALVRQLCRRPGALAARLTRGPRPAAFRISGWDGLQACEAAPAVDYGGAAQQYLVVWEDGRGAGSRGTDVYGRRVGAGGPAGADLPISGPAAITDELGPAEAWNSPSDEFLVVWQDGRNAAARGTDTYGREVPGSGLWPVPTSA